MSDFERLERRLVAVERALTEGDRSVRDVPERAAIADDIDRIEGRIDDLVARVADLEGSTQALRGYVGNVRSVNEDVERRADSAVATVDRLERRVEVLEGSTAEPNATVLVSRTDTRTHTSLKHTREHQETTQLTSRRLEDSSPIDHQQVEAQLAELSTNDTGETRASVETSTASGDGSSSDSDRSETANTTALENEEAGRDESSFEDTATRPAESTVLATIRRVLT